MSSKNRNFFNWALIYYFYKTLLLNLYKYANYIIILYNN
jgi:hypothetical protein